MLNVVALSVAFFIVTLNAVMLGVVMLGVVMLCVVAPTGLLNAWTSKKDRLIYGMPACLVCLISTAPGRSKKG